MRNTGPTRRGVTLIELLVVMGIMAILTAMAVAAYFLAAGGQKAQNTDATLLKVHSLLNQRWAAVLDDARDPRKPVPPAVVTYAGGDSVRARVVWIYIRLKEEFPTTQAEATTAQTFGGYTTKTRGIYGSTAGLLTAVTPASSSDADSFIAEAEESATCIFLALNKTGTGGTDAAADGLQNQIATGKAGQVYRDSWGRPITFVRMAFASELNAPPYIPGNKMPSPTNIDPVDPRGRLVGWSNLSDFWGKIWSNHIGCGTVATPRTNPIIPSTYSANNNWVPTLISAGPTNDTASAWAPWGQWFTTSDDTWNDNVLSFRLRAGQRGD